MFVTMVAVLCHLTAPDCTEVVVTNSSLESGLTLQECMIGGQASLAQWKENHPIYRSEDWQVGRYKCVVGRYEARAKI